MIKIVIKDSVKIIENRNKIHYFVSGIDVLIYYDRLKMFILNYLLFVY